MGEGLLMFEDIIMTDEELSKAREELMSPIVPKTYFTFYGPPGCKRPWWVDYKLED